MEALNIQNKAGVSVRELAKGSKEGILRIIESSKKAAEKAAEAQIKEARKSRGWRPTIHVATAKDHPNQPLVRNVNANNRASKTVSPASGGEGADLKPSSVVVGDRSPTKAKAKADSGGGGCFIQ